MEDIIWAFGLAFACHPYDVATVLILEEACCVIEKPDGRLIDCPLDTTTPVSWVAYANVDMANSMRPKLKELVKEHF